MRTKLAQVARVFFEGIWHASRYGLAAGVTSLLLSLFPLLVALIAVIIAGLVTVIFSALMLISAISGSADPPIAALFFAVLLPIAYAVGVILLFISLILAVLLYTGIIVLPISFVTDVLLRSFRIRSVLARTAIFFFVGALLGCAIAFVWLMLNLKTVWLVLNLQTDGLVGVFLAVVFIGVLLFLLGFSSIGLFGSFLTWPDKGREMVGRIVEKLSSQMNSRTQPVEKEGEMSLNIQF